MMDYIAANGHIIPLNQVRSIDFRDIDRIIVHTISGEQHLATEFEAFKIASLHYTEMEGKRLRWRKNSWAVHNLVAHPLLQICSWLGLTKLGMKIHDATVPKPINRAEDREPPR